MATSWVRELLGRFSDAAASLCASTAVAAVPQSHVAREVRGARVRPLDDAKERRKEAKAQREERLEKWFGLPKPQGRTSLSTR